MNFKDESWKPKIRESMILYSTQIVLSNRDTFDKSKWVTASDV